MARLRKRNLGPLGPGTFTRANGAKLDGTRVFGVEQETSDEAHGLGSENPFRTVRTRRHATPFSGEAIHVATQVNYGSFSGYIPGVYANLPSLPLVSGADSSLVNTIMARSNPSRPYVDTTIFVGELRDFPGMAKEIWDTARRFIRHVDRGLSPIERLNRAFRAGYRETFPKADSRFIEYQFGWLPMVSDIMKYMSVADVIEKRTLELNHLKRTGHSSRRTHFDSGRTASSATVNLDTKTSLVFKGVLQRSQSWERWGVGKWYLDSGGRLAQAKTVGQIRRLAEESVKGLALDAHTGWNLMPWSWLLDWAWNAGDWIESQRNIVGASKGSVSVMTYTNCLDNYSRYSGIDPYLEVKGGEGYILREQKLRTIHSGFRLPEITVPILSGRQSAILGSLMSMKARRS